MGKKQAVSPSRGSALLAPKRASYVEVLEGETFEVDRIASIPLPTSDDFPVLAVIPFRQVTERGFVCHDDNLGIRVLLGDKRSLISRRELVEIADVPYRLSALRFEPDDVEYREMVSRLIQEEIGGGAGSNFVLRRTLHARADTNRHDWRNEGARKALACLLEQDLNAYLRFCITLPDITMVGASPELHIEYNAGAIRMTPMSGTMRFEKLPTAFEVRQFLSNSKEREELFMVLDEELKMICRMDPVLVEIRGPRIDVFGKVAHTYFEIRAQTSMSLHDVLRESLLAPTVTGSPLREAFNVIMRNERLPRGFYGGVVCLLRREAGGVSLDSAIAIRTAYVTSDGEVTVPVGATIVRNSVPREEAAETASKASGIVAALRGNQSASSYTSFDRMLDQAGLQEELDRRQRQMSRFWLAGPDATAVNSFCGRELLVVDFDDDWTSVLGYLLNALGLHCTIINWRELTGVALNEWISELRVDALVLGPGPGDPTNEHDSRIRLAQNVAGIASRDPLPTLAVCLSHQCVSRHFGLALKRLHQPFQGASRLVVVDNTEYVVGFYNSFAAFVEPAEMSRLPREMELWFDAGTGEVFGFAIPQLVSVQFHLESAVSRDGISVARRLLSKLLHDQG